MTYQSDKPKRTYTMEENITDVVFRSRDANKKLDEVLLQLQDIKELLAKSPFPASKDLPF